MAENLIKVAQEQIDQSRKDFVVSFIKARLLRKANLEKDLVVVEKELSELSSLPLEEAYDKYNKYENYTDSYRGKV